MILLLPCRRLNFPALGIQTGIVLLDPVAPEFLWAFFRTGVPPLTLQHDPNEDNDDNDDNDEAADDEDYTIINHAGIWPHNP